MKKNFILALSLMIVIFLLTACDEDNNSPTPKTLKADTSETTTNAKGGDDPALPTDDEDPTDPSKPTETNKPTDTTKSTQDNTNPTNPTSTTDKPKPTDPEPNKDPNDPFAAMYYLKLPRQMHIEYNTYYEGKVWSKNVFIKVGNDCLYMRSMVFMDKWQHFLEYYKYVGNNSWKKWNKNVLDYSNFTFGIEGSGPADQAVITFADALAGGEWESTGVQPAETVLSELETISLFMICDENYIIEIKKKDREEWWEPDDLRPVGSGKEDYVRRLNYGAECDVYTINGKTYYHDPVTNIIFQISGQLETTYLYWSEYDLDITFAGYNVPE